MHPSVRCVGPATLFALAMLALCWTDPAGAARILLVGDSITAGTVGGTEPGTPYADLVAQAFPAHDTVNAGCGGASTSDWLIPGPSLSCAFAGAFEELAEPNLPARISTILLGTNDATGFFEPSPNCCPVSAETYRANLEGLIARLEPETLWIVLMTPPPSSAGNPDVDARLAAYRGEVLDLCSFPADSVVCGPDLQALLDPVLHFPSGPHPNPEGHALIAEALVVDLVLLVPEPGTSELVLAALAALALARSGRRRG